MVSTGYAKIAGIRFRELKTRCIIAAFIAVIAWLLAPSIWPMVWFAAVLITQSFDWLIFRPLRQRHDFQMSVAYQVVCCVTAAVNVIVYSWIAAYLWFYGGEAGRLFGIIQIAGGLLHVSLHMHHVRPLLLAAATPHALYFLGLPTFSALQSGRAIELLFIVGGGIYLMHLAVAVSQSLATTRALETANDEARTQRRQAEVANAAKSDFLAVITHEIRTPMNAVISAATLLKRTPLDTAQTEHVAMLSDAGEVMIGLLNDVLDLSKIEAGKMNLEATEIDLHDKLHGLNRLWNHKATMKGIQLELNLADDIPERVLADPLRLQQILFNLLSNAIKFTDKGTVTVDASWSAPFNTLIVTVIDTGCGIAPHRMENVFQSFEQAEAGTTRRYGGTGLGLSISRRLAELMGGTLSAESRLGEGSRFTVSLPLQPLQSTSKAANRTQDLAISLRGRTILAAEDHPVNRRILQLLLEVHDCHLTMVENGLEAVKLADEQSFDAILMDMQMPILDGLDAATRIRQSGMNQTTPIIALTANAMDLHRSAWEAVGAFAFLTKPIDAVLLAETLAQACQQPRDDMSWAVDPRRESLIA